MKLSLHEGSESAFIPLRDAMLCLDCQFIIPPGSNMCSVCGGRMLVGVVQILTALLEESSPADAVRRFAGKSQCRLQLVDSETSRLRSQGR